MSAHTPGPWVMDEFYEAGGFYKIRGEKAILCLIHSIAESGSDPTALANARLIAAAPELLAAAKLQVLNFQRQRDGGWLGDDDHEAWTALSAAIAKAEGR